MVVPGWRTANGRRERGRESTRRGILALERCYTDWCASILEVLMAKTKRTRSVRRGAPAGGRADRQNKQAAAVDKTDSDIEGVLALPASSVARAEDGSVPRGAETRVTGWKRRVVSVVRDFPPGCGPAWLIDQPLTTAK
ncbi:hypothetical protein L1987_08707 [Smallanthus sonchifolius]|uniref:Uncharacterized protein n=1 Tax=Smallanthus sonchifolius TaxID=185202 RepID=A0ACB9JNL4_9ASTR|nr:hypothetical protein L1987_08707 [Smallanthus sonchifolius]